MGQSSTSLSDRDTAIAVGFAKLGNGVPDNTPAGPLLEAFKRAVEAYEAALPNPWRPISQLPDNASFIGPIGGGILYVSFMTDQGEVFRTIEPPQKG